MGNVRRSAIGSASRSGRLARVAAAAATVVAVGSAVLSPAPARALAPEAAPQARATAGAAGVASAATTDPFYTWTGLPLGLMAPGTVLRTRTVPYHLVGLPLVPLTAVQILFRTTDARGRAVAGVTSVVRPLLGSTGRVVAYNSFYDSLNPEDGPSRSIAGNVSLGGAIANVETAFIVPLLLQGFAVNVADTQGPTADFAAGPEYGMVTLDSLRAALKVPATRIAPTARIGLLGYSGGAIATNWAAALAPSYAPDIDRRLVGAAEGGVLVRPAQNLPYISGSSIWAGVAPMAIVGVSRAFGIDLRPYLSDLGLRIYDKLQNATISQVLGAYPGLTFEQLTKPEFNDPASIPVFVDTVNRLNLGTRPSPSVPMFIGQGTFGELEGTSGDQPGIGAGDGVMVAGDVRSLARQYCDDGLAITYREYPLSHFLTAALWAPQALTWLAARFGPAPAPSNCASIRPGNPLTPLARR